MSDNADAGLRLQPDGTAEIQVGGATRVLRAPTLGQYRDIKKACIEANRVRRRRAAIIRDSKTTASEVEELESVDPLDDTLPVAAKIFDLLCDTPVTEDEYPPWLVDGMGTPDDALERLLIHWRSVPLGHGSTTPTLPPSPDLG